MTRGTPPRGSPGLSPFGDVALGDLPGLDTFEDEEPTLPVRARDAVAAGELPFFEEEDDDVPASPPEPANTSIDIEIQLPEEEARMLVALQPDGRVQAPTQAARDVLRTRMRRAEVLRTGPRWVVLRALEQPPEAVGPAPDREVIAAGTLGDACFSLIDFIGFLASGLQTGVLTAASGDVERSVFFFRGDVVWASSSAQTDRLGEFLLRRGRITREQLHVAVRDTSKPLGRACVERGFLAAHELFAMVQAQLTEIFDRLLATENGIWYFARMSNKTLAESQIHLSTQGLLVDALRRLDEMQIYRQRVRTSDTLVQRARPKQDASSSTSTSDLVSPLEEGLRGSAATLLKQLPGSATISELMRILGKGEFEVTRTVYHLLRRGLVEIVQPNETGPIPRRVSTISKTEAREVIGTYSMAIREMFEEVARVDRAAELQASANAFLRDESTEYSHLLSAAALAEDGSIDEASMLAALQDMTLGAQELSDALSELLFFVLFQATEFLGRRRGDDLARRVKLILGMLQHPHAAGGGPIGG